MDAVSPVVFAYLKFLEDEREGLIHVGFTGLPMLGSAISSGEVYKSPCSF